MNLFIIIYDGVGSFLYNFVRVQRDHWGLGSTSWSNRRQRFCYGSDVETGLLGKGNEPPSEQWVLLQTGWRSYGLVCRRNYLHLKNMKDKEVIDKETFDYLRPQNTRTTSFYILPKIRKDGVLGRPIVSSCGFHTEKISQFVDYHLHPLVTKIPSYIKDTIDFLLKLKSVGKVPPGSLWLT